MAHITLWLVEARPLLAYTVMQDYSVVHETKVVSCRSEPQSAARPLSSGEQGALAQRPSQPIDIRAPAELRSVGVDGGQRARGGLSPRSQAAQVSPCWHSCLYGERRALPLQTVIPLREETGQLCWPRCAAVPASSSSAASLCLRCLGHPLLMASATRTAASVSLTSCTRSRLQPWDTPAQAAAALPSARSAGDTGDGGAEAGREAAAPNGSAAGTQRECQPLSARQCQSSAADSPPLLSDR